MLRGVVYRLIGSLASMGHCSIWKLICAISVCNTLTVGVHLSSTPSISGPGSATGHVQNIGMPVTFNTGCFTKDSFLWGKTVIFFIFESLKQMSPHGNHIETYTARVYTMQYAYLWPSTSQSLISFLSLGLYV